MTSHITESERWLWLLLDGTLKASVMLAVAWIATRSMRKESAALRHCVWAIAALSALGLPVLSNFAVFSHWEVANSVSSVWASAPRRAVEEATSALPTMMVSAGRKAPLRASVTHWLLGIWATGAGAGLLALLLGTLRLAWLASRAEALFDEHWMRTVVDLSRGMGLHRPVRLLLSRGATMPVTWGAMRPRILLPAEALEWTEERRRVVLSHELAHVRRHDWPVQLLAEVVRALYWFNPLVWFGVNRLRQESEQACDDAVLNSGVEAPDYAGHLLALARQLKSSDRAWAVALAMARQSNLERRFIAMLSPSLNRNGVSTRAAFLTTIATLCLLLPLAALRAPAQDLSGKITGTVYDVSGGVIPNATVIISNAAAKTKDMTTSDASGIFEFSGLPAGQCVIEVLKPGFARFLATDLTLEPNQGAYRKVTLPMGTVSETISVVGEGTPKASTASRNATPERIKMGGNVQATQLVKQVRPVYPPIAKQAGIEGSVLMEAVIATDGSLISLRVMNSQIDPDLAKAAVEAVSQWRYRPTLLNGVPVEIVTQITVNFTLKR